MAHFILKGRIKQTFKMKKGSESEIHPLRSYSDSFNQKESLDFRDIHKKLKIIKIQYLSL